MGKGTTLKGRGDAPYILEKEFFLCMDQRNTEFFIADGGRKVETSGSSSKKKGEVPLLNGNLPIKKGKKFYFSMRS